MKCNCFLICHSKHNDIFSCTIIETLHFLYHFPPRCLCFLQAKLFNHSKLSLSSAAHSCFSIIFSYLAWFNGWLNELRLECGRTSHRVNEPWKGQAHIIVWTVLIISPVSDTWRRLPKLCSVSKHWCRMFYLDNLFSDSSAITVFPLPLFFISPTLPLPLSLSTVCATKFMFSSLYRLPTNLLSQAQLWS